MSRMSRSYDNDSIQPSRSYFLIRSKMNYADYMFSIVFIKKSKIRHQETQPRDHTGNDPGNKEQTEESPRNAGASTRLTHHTPGQAG